MFSFRKIGVTSFKNSSISSKNLRVVSSNSFNFKSMNLKEFFIFSPRESSVF